VIRGRHRARLLLLCVLAVAVLGGAWAITRVKRAALIRKMESVEIPVYPGGQGVSRAMDSHASILVVQYMAPVKYPSTDVLRFYDNAFAGRGWVFSRRYPSLSGNRKWQSFTTASLSADLARGGRSQPRFMLDATYVNEQRGISVCLLILGGPDSSGQHVTLNVWPRSQPEIPL